MANIKDYDLFFGEVRLTYGSAMVQEIRRELEAHPERTSEDNFELALLAEMHKRHPEIRKSMQDAIEMTVLGIEQTGCSSIL